ncbi:unnamed protein product, partial [Mesorhabditis belari]|uniref:Uncharacterized protein n=1 Tax=Mesorhabditis belari TaxID=2138241 RepID=A0AAF3FRY2_9BILA
MNSSEKDPQVPDGPPAYSTMQGPLPPVTTSRCCGSTPNQKRKFWTAAHGVYVVVLASGMLTWGGMEISRQVNTNLDRPMFANGGILVYFLGTMIFQFVMLSMTVVGISAIYSDNLRRLRGYTIFVNCLMAGTLGSIAGIVQNFHVSWPILILLVNVVIECIVMIVLLIQQRRSIAHNPSQY